MRLHVPRPTPSDSNKTEPGECGCGIPEGTCQNNDITPPEILVVVSPDILWPPNHKMVSIAVTVTVTDDTDPDPDWELTSITMNEGDETSTYDPEYDHTLGDGNTADDIQVVDKNNILLRAERSGLNSGRIYTIVYTATDDSGNTSTAAVTVTVPHSM